MRRALDEYVITGIKTSLPFFSWLMAERDFLEGRFHTAYLDQVLDARSGRSFAQPTSDQEELAAIAAAVHATLFSASPAPASQDANGPTGVVRRWKSQARAEGLRE
jgi:acetyl/propionyl-CoA carboxylase alpha subunit